MINVATLLLKDEAGFVVSAELVLIATITVIGLVVGLTEVASAVNQELEDVGAAIGSLNQSYYYSGFSGCKGRAFGSSFKDHVDECDAENDIVCNFGPVPEASKGGHGGSDY